MTLTVSQCQLVNCVCRNSGRFQEDIPPSRSSHLKQLIEYFVLSVKVSGESTDNVGNMWNSVKLQINV